MIELKSIKSYNARDSKFNQAKSQVMFDKSKSIKFTSSCTCNDLSDNRLVIYLGLTNGSIVAITLYKKDASQTLNEYDDNFKLLSCYDQFKHKGPVSVLLSEKIDNTPIIFSGGADGTIKLWLGDPNLREKEMVHHIKTLLEHKSTVISMAFCKSRSLLISSSSDMSMKIFRMKDKFDKILNPRFECISTIRDFHIKLNKDRDLPYWISSLSLKETDIIELYAGDTKGRILFYHYIDDNYLKYKGSGGHALELEGINKNNFNFLYAVNLHKKWGTIKVVHSEFDNVIYSAGFNNHIVCYNIKNQQKVFEVANSNSKTYFSCLTIDNLTQELIVGDDIGNINFIQIYNKSEIKKKAMNNKILSIQSLKLFGKQKHVLVVSEDNLKIYDVIRKSKVSDVQHHENELIKLFVIEPIIINDRIIEDTKIISCAYDNMIKIWDFLTMECINKISGPELPRKNVEIRSVCYLDNSGLIAVGTDVGHIFFWDLSKSQYLPIMYEKAIRHKGIVTDMVSYISYGKENHDYVECMLSCSTDGLILFWEITKTEIKQSNKKYNYEEIEDLIVKKEKEMKEYDSEKNSNNNTKINSRILGKDNQNENNNEENEKKEKEKEREKIMKKYPELKNYKCTPTIKRNIRKSELEFNSIGFNTNLQDKYVFTGGDDSFIYLWDYIKEDEPLSKTKSLNPKITKIIFDKKLAITGGNKGYIELWTIFKEKKIEQGKEKIIPSLIQTKYLKDPDISIDNNLRIHDLLMLKNNIGLLVSCNNNKSIHFWKYEEDKDKKKIEGEKKTKEEEKNTKEELIKPVKTVTKGKEVTCLACDENYGKLLCGTKEKIIMEIDLAEELKDVEIKHSYEKYAFLKNSANYQEDEIDKKIDNFKIMKSLTQGIG